MASSARIEELTRKFDENPRRYFAPLANEYRKAGDLEQAIALCEEYLPQQPGHMSGHVVYGQALFESGKLEESRSVFETALQLDPENLIALRYLGDIAQQQGDRDGARQWYNRVLETDPRNEEIQALLRHVDEMRTPPWAAPVAPPAPDAFATEAAVLEPDVSADEPSPFAEARDTEDALPGELPPAVIDAEGELLEDDALLTDFTTPDAPVAPLEGLTSSTFEAPTEGELGALPELEVTGLVEPIERGPAAPREAAPVDARHESELADEPFELGSFGTEGIERETDVGDMVGHAPEVSPFGAAPAREERVDERVDEPLDLDDSFEIPGAPHVAEVHAQPAEAPLAEAEPAESMELPETLSFEHEPGDSAPLQVGPSEEESAQAAPHAADFAEPVRDEIDAEPAPASFVTATMAELYLRQGHRDAALDVYRQLVAQSPDDERLRNRVAELERSAETTIRGFLAGIASRGPRGAVIDATGGSTGGSSQVASGEWVAVSESASDASSMPVEVMGWGETTDVVAEVEVAGESSASEATETSELPGELTPAVIDAVGEMMPDAVPGESGAAETPRRSAPAFSVDESAVPFDLPRTTPPSSPSQQPGGPAAPGTVDALFGNAPASEADTGRASTLAEAFAPVDSRTPLAGRPAVAARDELSLDRVFRSEEGGETGRTGGFSFDQFFGSRTPHAGGTPVPPPSSPTPPGSSTARGTPTSNPATNADDIEQFNSWLQGLKKR